MKLISLENIKDISDPAYQFLTQNILSNLEDGRYELPNGIYINIESYATKAIFQSIYESHRRYIDIQYIISGREYISVAPIDTLSIHKKYSSEQDVTIYQNNIAGTNFLLSKGNALMLFPSDGHMPCLRVDEARPENVKKAVLKIPLSLTKHIRALIMDVDGTLTDGKIYISDHGELCKAFDIKDGCGIHDILIPSGIIPIIITGRKSKILENRCLELGISELHQGVSNKAEKLYSVLRNLNLDYSSVAYIGDDINDLSCMQIIKRAGGIVACPNNAVAKIKDISDYICSLNGGNGAVRELIEWILLNDDKSYI